MKNPIRNSLPDLKPVWGDWFSAFVLLGLMVACAPAVSGAAQDEVPGTVQSPSQAASSQAPNKGQAATPDASSQASKPAESRKPVVITSENMDADNKAHRALFTGNVVAQTETSTIYADSMNVLYDGASGRIDRIDCKGSVKVVRGDRVILSDESTYFGPEDKMVFRGNPRIMDGQNLVTGSLITYFQSADRLIVEKSRVYMPPK